MNTIAAPQEPNLTDRIRLGIAEARRRQPREVALSEAERRQVLAEIEAPVELELAPV